MAGTVPYMPCSGNAWQLEASTEDPISEHCCVPAHGHSAIRVKNTFIHAFLIGGEDEDEQEPPMVATKSCPAVRMCSSSALSTSDGESSSDDAAEQRWPVARPKGAEQRAVPGQGQVTQCLPTVHVVPLELRKPEHSAGSKLHGAGKCKPCAWFWRPQGCDNGTECRHCHLCVAGELKARRKARASAARQSFRRPMARICRKTDNTSDDQQARS